MYAGSLGTVSNREDYIQEWQTFDEDGDALDLTGATIVYEFRDPATKSAIATATNVIATTTITSTIPVATMRGLCAKDYEVGITIKISSVTTQLVAGTIAVVDGVVS